MYRKMHADYFNGLADKMEALKDELSTEFNEIADEVNDDQDPALLAIGKIHDDLIEAVAELRKVADTYLP